MEENNNNENLSKTNNKIYQIVIIIVFIIAIVFGINIKNQNEGENTATDNTTNIDSQTEEYADLNINTDELNIFYFYVGQADSMLITMNGYTMLIDSGNSSDGQKIVDFIKAQGITKIDYLIGTHIDEDHIGGIPTVIQELDVGIIYMPYNEYSKECYDNIVAVAGEKITSIEASSETTYS